MTVVPVQANPLEIAVLVKATPFISSKGASPVGGRFQEFYLPILNLNKLR